MFLPLNVSPCRGCDNKIILTAVDVDVNSFFAKCANISIVS